MNGLSNFKHGVKRTSAVIMAALIIASGAQAALISADAAEITETASSASTLSDDARGVIYANSRTDFRDESIYFLITTRFYDGDSSNNARTSEDTKAQNPENDPSWRGDFKGLIDKLDYIKALGFTAIWITPVVENDSGYDYHGYHAYDFSAVDKRYESNGVTYQTLIDACHRKGMKVIQDIVLNHTCNWGERNLLQLTSDVYSERNQVVMNGNGDPDNIYHHNGFCGGGDWDNYEAQDRTIADDCFDLETENPKVYNYLVDCYTNYINMGVDAFRVDTVKHISRLTLNSVFVPAFKKAGGENFYMFGEVCTKGHDVWYREHPPISTSFYTWAETGSWANCWTNDLATNESLVQQHYTAHNDMNNQPTSSNAFLNGNDYHTPDYSQRSGMDAIDFQMHWSFNNANEAFSTALGEDRYFNDSTWNVVYVDSHDYGPDNCQTQRYTGGTDAWAENLALMFTFRGIPCIYYGSEIEFQAGMPIDVGPNAPLSQTGRAYYGDHIEGDITATDFTVFDKNLSGEVKNTLSSKLSQQIIRLNRIRQTIPALRKGQYSTEGCSGNIAFKRRYTDSTTDSFVCVAISGNATFSGIPNGKYVDAVTGDVQNVSGGTLTANVSGKGNMKVYVLDTAKTPAPGRVIPNGDYLTDGGSSELILGTDIDIVDPTNITLNKSSVSLYEGDTQSLTATVSPSNATNKSVTWTTSNSSVATVSGGTINAVGSGTAIITAKTVNGLTASCTVKVTENPDIIKPTGITLDKSSLEIKSGSTGTLTATVKPTNATNKTVTWTSSNPSVATVSGGTVTAVSTGTTIITASTYNGFTAACTVTVPEPEFEYVDHGFYFEKPSSWGSNINVYIYDASTNSPVGASWPGTSMKKAADGIYSYEYSTTNSNLRIIFNDGNKQSPASQQEGFKYVDKGYYTTNGYQKTIEPKEDVDVTSVTLNKTSLSLEAGNTSSLTATVAPSNATNKTITWTSSNTSVAKVSSSGVVTAVAAGTATVTASSSNGKTATCKITVTASVSDLVNNSKVSTTNLTLGDTLTITGGASGGTSPYKYAFYYKRSTATAWTTIGTAYGTATTAYLKPLAAVSYDVKVIVKDNAGKTATKTFTVNVTNATLTNSSKVSTTNLTLGDTLTITCGASGGTSPYKYAFYYKRSTATAWTTIGTAYGTATTASLKPLAAVNYDVKVIVKDNAGKTATKTFTITVTSATLTNKSSISATTINLGDTLKLTGAATGGTGSYKYAYYCKRSTATAWATLGTEFGTATSASVKPTGAVTYDIKIVVKDSASKTATKTFTVNVVSAAVTNKSTVSATTLNLGNTLTITGAASGGTSPYKYAFYYKRSTATAWTTIGTAYGTATTASLKPLAAVNYDVKIIVKDNAGKTATKTFTVNVVSTALTNKSTVSATTLKLGDTLKITGAASGGSGNYSYAYYCKRSTATSWTLLGTEYGTATSASVKPTSAVNYDIMVKIVDSTGETVTKTFSVSVTK